MRALTKFYFDYAATTPLDPRVFRAMSPFFNRSFGNPSGLYKLGREAEQALTRARRSIAGILGCLPSEFIFTASATEADNLVILGAARALKHLGNRLIISSIEHKGILSAATALEEEGFEIISVGGGKPGLINPKEVEMALKDKTILLSLSMADSE